MVEHRGACGSSKREGGIASGLPEHEVTEPLWQSDPAGVNPPSLPMLGTVLPDG